jgi:hypothetical protein
LETSRPSRYGPAGPITYHAGRQSACPTPVSRPLAVAHAQPPPPPPHAAASASPRRGGAAKDPSTRFPPSLRASASQSPSVSGDPILAATSVRNQHPHLGRPLSPGLRPIVDPRPGDSIRDGVASIRGRAAWIHSQAVSIRGQATSLHGCWHQVFSQRPVLISVSGDGSAASDGDEDESRSPAMARRPVMVMRMKAGPPFSPRSRPPGR